MHCKEWYIIMLLPSFSPGHWQQKMLAVFNEAGPVGRSTGIAFGTVAKVWLGCNKLKARDHQTWKMGERRTAAGSRRRAMPGSEGMTAKKTFSPISREFDGNEEWAKVGVVEGSISTLFLDAITFAFNCSCYKKAFILIWSCQNLDNTRCRGN